jgi:hypothetical protein
MVVLPEGCPTIDLLLTRGTLELRRETFPQLSVEHILLFVDVAQMLSQFGIILVGVTATGVRADKGSVQPFQTFQCRRLRNGFSRSRFWPSSFSVWQTFSIPLMNSSSTGPLLWSACVTLQSWPAIEDLAAEGTIEAGEMMGEEVRAEQVNAAEAPVAEPAGEDGDLMALTDVVVEVGQGGESDVTEVTGACAPLRGQLHVRQLLVQGDLFHVGNPLVPH